MFGDDWFGGSQPAFAGAGDFGPGEETGWGGPRGGPWGPRGPFGKHGPFGRRGPWGRHGRGFGFGGPGGGPWGFGPPPMARFFARRFPFGPGMGPGPFGPGMGPRMFGRGDLKYALLELLTERPKHGYEMIKDLEERSGGFYTPSAGAVYPTLQLLEDRGWVSVETVEGKKVYAISDVGREALGEHSQRRDEERGPRGPWFRGGPGGGPDFGPGFGPGFGRGGHHHERHEHEHERHHEHEHEQEHHRGRGPRGPRGPFGFEFTPELADLGRESIEVARLMRNAVMSSTSDPERLRRLRAIMARTRGELNEFLGQARQDGGPRQEPGAGSGSGSGSDAQDEPPTAMGGPIEQV